jgi:hypothetical protein
MNVRIHRGAREVGGTCVELSSGGERIVLDVGMPMGDPPLGRDRLPDVPGRGRPATARCAGSSSATSIPTTSGSPTSGAVGPESGP